MGQGCAGLKSLPCGRLRPLVCPDSALPTTHTRNSQEHTSAATALPAPGTSAPPAWPRGPRPCHTLVLTAPLINKLVPVSGPWCPLFPRPGALFPASVRLALILGLQEARASLTPTGAPLQFPFPLSPHHPLVWVSRSHPVSASPAWGQGSEPSAALAWGLGQTPNSGPPAGQLGGHVGTRRVWALYPAGRGSRADSEDPHRQEAAAQEAGVPLRAAGSCPVGDTEAQYTKTLTLATFYLNAGPHHVTVLSNA